MACDVEPYVTQRVWEDTGLVLMARVMTVANVAAQQADISSIALKVYDSADRTTTIATATPVVADTIYDTLQTGGPWSKDSTGYNFRYLTTASQLPAGNKTYRFEFMVTPASGAPMAIVYEVPTADLWGS